jgi:hypothetical protein
MAHRHGAHQCYCPQCGYQTEVDAYVRCNNLYCPDCGQRLRARETGEFRSGIAIKEGVMAIATNSIPCPVCRYPIPAPTEVGQEVKCAWCSSISEAIQQGITIPTSLFVGILSFGLGVILGPALIATTKSGSEWLARQARERIK